MNNIPFWAAIICSQVWAACGNRVVSCVWLVLAALAQLLYYLAR